MGENAIGKIRWPISENPPIGAKISQKISYASRVIAHFVPNFVAMATRGRGGNGEGKWGREREGKGKGKEKGKEKAKGKGRWKGDSLRNVGRMDAWTDTKVILYSVQCYA